VKLKSVLVSVRQKVEMKSNNLVVKVNLRDRRIGQLLVAKDKYSEVDSEHITGEKGDKKNDSEGTKED
jgi:hypothetical protein